MTGFLLDTNVVSELTKRRPDPDVVGWLRAARECYLSVLTIGELERGVWLLRRRDATRADTIELWLDQLKKDYADRILPIDLDVTGAWAQRPALRSVAVVDALLAATAAAHELTVVTRNVSDFADAGVPVIDPFARS